MGVQPNILPDFVGSTVVSSGTRSRFITLEGGEAAGKSTQVALLQVALERLGFQVISTREPGGTPLGEAIRHLLKYAPEGRGMSNEAEILLFQASRAELVRKVIRPALEAGHWVICDRFYDSTTVYQGCARALPADSVKSLIDFAVGSTRPGLTLVLDLDPGIARQRSRQRREKLRASMSTSGVSGDESPVDRLEAESDAFFRAVRAGFHVLEQAEPARVKRISAEASVETVATCIWKEVSHAFSL